MYEDYDGFCYPIVNRNKCISCSLCESVCPVDNINLRNWETKTFIIQNFNEDIRKISSAGGFVGAVCSNVFQKQGVVYGACFNKNNMVIHKRLESMEECIDNNFFSSKYVSSDLSDTFNQVKKDLNSGLFVCYVGLPCQIAGLHKFLGKNYDGLLLIDLTCYGVPSKVLYKKYLDFIEHKYNSKIAKVLFRDKIYGYSAPTMTLVLNNGKSLSQKSDVKSYLRTFFSNLSMRSSCYDCSFKGVNRISDITIGDCKNVREFDSSFDDDKGTTVVYIHSEKGLNLFKNISTSIRSISVDVDKIVNTCGKKMIESAPFNSYRDEFFQKLEKEEYSKVINSYCPPNIEERIANIVKTMLLYTGLNRTSFLRKLKGR